jgi:hypothetical protein
MPIGMKGFQKHHEPWNKGLAGVTSGEKSSNWAGGKPKCTDCGKLLKDYHSKRCNKCYGVSIKGVNHPHWDGGIAKNRAHINKRLRERRHELGISKHYRGEKWGTGKGSRYACRGKDYGEDWHEIRKEIYKRDDWVCRECGCKCVGSKKRDHSRIIQCHHIDYNEKNHCPSNLITLCLSCHSKTNFNRDNWTEYFMRGIKNT